MSQHICLATFDRPVSVRAAVGQLRAIGFEGDQLEVISAEPIHIRPDTKKSHLGTFALVGALVGGTGGLLLAALSASAYPIVKGGMPIVSPWPVSIVTYEATMLGAILSTLLGLLVELRLPNFRRLPYDKIVADGGILVAVRCPEDGKKKAVEQAVSAAGAKKVSWLDG